MRLNRFVKICLPAGLALGLCFFFVMLLFPKSRPVHSRHASRRVVVNGEERLEVAGATFAELVSDPPRKSPQVETRQVTEHLAPAVDEIARQIADVHAGRRRSRGVYLPEPRGQWAAFAARRLEEQLQRRGVPLVENERSSRSRTMTIKVVEHGDASGGPVIVVAGSNPSYERRIVCGVLGAEAEAVVLGPSDFFVHLKTSVQLTREDSAEDARDALARRIESDLFRRMLADGRLDEEDDGRFRADLRRRYGRDLLLSQGDARLLTVEQPSGDLTHYVTYASWRSGEDAVDAIARSVTDAIRLERLLPFIRAGLALGALILAIVGWMKLDWWLKGHHSFLTKLLCGILWLISVGVIWRFPIHG
jgi:hypothetical protein